MNNQDQTNYQFPGYYTNLYSIKDRLTNHDLVYLHHLSWRIVKNRLYHILKPMQLSLESFQGWYLLILAVLEEFQHQGFLTNIWTLYGR